MGLADSPRILQICHGYDGPFLDCARQYAVLFRETSYQVTTVFLTGKPSAQAEQGAASDEVIFLDYSSRDLRGAKLRAIGAIRRLASDPRYRLCIAHRFKPTFIACIATRLPVIGVNHAFGVYRRPARRLFANFFRSRLTLFGVSDAVRDDLRTALPHWPAARIDTLYNRLDFEAVRASQLSREAARAYLELPQESWIVGNVGRLHPDKDQVTLIHGFALALPRLPANALLIIVGQGRLAEELQRLTRRLGVAEQVRFLGQVPEARRFFKAFDAFAMTSDHEPFGMVLLEAMAAGVPTLCSDCGGGREVVRDPERLFPQGQPEELADVLVRLSTDPQPQRVIQVQFETLRSVFSDAAARRRFWSLPGMSELG